MPAWPFSSIIQPIWTKFEGKFSRTWDPVVLILSQSIPPAWL